MAILELQYKYRANVTQRRCRVARDAIVTDSVPVYVAELDESSMPVAFLFRDERIERNGGVSEEIRFDGRQHWRVFRGMRFDGRPTLPKSADVLRVESGRKADLEWRDTPFSGFLVPRGHQDCDVQIDQDAMQYAAVHSDDRDKRRADIIAQAMRTGILNGEMWVACGEPCWIRSTSDERNYHAGLATMEDIVASKQFGVPLRFDRPPDVPRDRLIGEIEALIPEAVVLPLARLRFRRAVDHVAYTLGEMNASRLTDDQFSIYAALRRILSVVEPGEIDARLEEAVSRLKETDWRGISREVENLAILREEWMREEAEMAERVQERSRRTAAFVPGGMP